MSTVESRAALVAFKSTRRLSGKSIDVSRGSTSGSISCVPADTIVDQETEDSSTVRLKVRDYLLTRSDFEETFGFGAKPERGDRFDEEFDGYVRRFEVIELGGEAYRYWDKSLQVLRIHTIEIAKKLTLTAGDGSFVVAGTSTTLTKG